MQGRHIALIGLIMLLIGWPDATFVAGLLYGFSAVGFSPSTRLSLLTM